MGTPIGSDIHIASIVGFKKVKIKVINSVFMYEATASLPSN